MYTLESLKPLNVVYDSYHRLEQKDVDMANDYVRFIESTRGEKPCPGDIIDYTDEYGDYCKNSHVEAYDDGTGRLLIQIRPFVPFMRNMDDEKDTWFNSSGGPHISIDTNALSYIGKREKLFEEFGHCLLPAHGAVCFNATVNVWECIAPNQKYPGYSTKDWDRRYISYIEKLADGSAYHYYGQDIVFRDAAEYQRWKHTYKAVVFDGTSPTQSVVFHYREIDKLISREEWDALDLPLDTRFVNGIIHVKVDYDDNAHIVTVYRFTNSGYLNPKHFNEFEKAKGTSLVAPEPEVR